MGKLSEEEGELELAKAMTEGKELRGKFCDILHDHKREDEWANVAIALYEAVVDAGWRPIILHPDRLHRSPEVWRGPQQKSSDVKGC